MDLLNQHIVPEKCQERLSDYLIDVFEELPSRKAVKKAITKSRIRINGKVGKTGDYLSEGDVIELFDEVAVHPPYKFKVEVVYEDDYFAVVNKPAGLKISGNEHQNLQNCLSFNLKSSSQADALVYPRPAHRLDKSTSGLVLVAKTYSYLRYFLDLFENRNITKEYHALVQGKLTGNGEIREDVDGKPSSSLYEVVQVIPSIKNDFLSLVSLDPKTGRKHQLRKHLASINHPIVGDNLYNLEGKLKHKGLFLCATKLSLVLPDEKLFSVEIPLPKKFKSLIDREKRWMERLEEKRKLKDFIESSEVIQELLDSVSKIERKDLYLSAGCIRNTYWDSIYSRKNDLEDVDVIFLGEGDETEIESQLKILSPNYNWSVKNQARMHSKHGHDPYETIEEAISFWPEKATSVAIIMKEDGLKIIAPHGLKDIFDGRVSKPDKASEEAFQLRLRKKKWLEKWPELTIS